MSVDHLGSEKTRRTRAGGRSALRTFGPDPNGPLMLAGLTADVPRPKVRLSAPDQVRGRLVLRARAQVLKKSMRGTAKRAHARAGA